MWDFTKWRYGETAQGMARLVEDEKRLDENYMEKLTAVNKQTPPLRPVKNRFQLFQTSVGLLRKLLRQMAFSNIILSNPVFIMSLKNKSIIANITYYI